MKLFVGNLPYDVREDELRDMFSAHGQVASVAIINDRDTGRSKGFGFVEMPSQAEAEKAIKELNDKQMNGRAIKVNEARPKEDRPRRRF